MSKDRVYDIVVIGAGASGMMAAIIAARRGQNVLILEKLARPGAKLKASGGGRCNLSNTLDNEMFMERFGKNGRFMQHALQRFDHMALRAFFSDIGVETDVLDGFRIFPVGHDAQAVVSAMTDQIDKLHIHLQTLSQVDGVQKNANGLFVITCQSQKYLGKNLIISTGGKGYPGLGANGDGYLLGQEFGHSTSRAYPAMMPLKTEEKWGASCRADTIPDATILVDIKKYHKLRARGDLIFTKDGIRGPAVLDFSREVTPLLDKMDKVPILINMTKGMDEESIRSHIRRKLQEPTHYTTYTLLSTLLPPSVAQVFCTLAGAKADAGFAKQPGRIRDHLVRLLAWTPMTIIGHDGFDYAMVTRGGIKLREIDSKTMQSKLTDGLYFCGEVIDLDGPCGGYNLQWAFSSGYLAGVLAGD
jgi:predicted Rossmann fold flavoprotein